MHLRPVSAAVAPAISYGSSSSAAHGVVPCQQQQPSTAMFMCLQKALGSSAQLHKRALHFEHACRAKDGTIAQQQAALDSRHHDISVLQNKVDDLKQKGTNDQSIIAKQAATIATLEGDITKAIAVQEGCLAYVEGQLAKLECEESEQDITHLSPLKDPKVGAMLLSCFVMCLYL